MDKNLKSGSGSGMACPRCRGPVAVSSNPVLMQFGLIGALIQLLTTSYSCPACGPIKFKEFPPEVQQRSRRNTLLGILVGVVLIAAVVGLIVYFQR